MEKIISEIAKDASEWALSKVGCAYSQTKRTDERAFDCSSLVARAFTAQGKKWKYGGEVPTSDKEPYDDEFELIWPHAYEDIGKSFGGKKVIHMANMVGDLQFICTDQETKRKNRITHVAMIVSDREIVHARSKRYGVCIDELNHYNGKICALTRYNPKCALRRGMKGFRTIELQKKLNRVGAGLIIDGDFGPKTEAAVRAFQSRYGLLETGEADNLTLNKLSDVQNIK